MPGLRTIEPARVADGQRIYAIGDVHGRADLLQRLFEFIDAHSADISQKSTTVVLIGDLIDRGPASRDVIDIVIKRQRLQRLICLLGNHEQMMLAFLDEQQRFDGWREVGGYETIVSYGLKRRPIRSLADRQQLWRDFRSAVPDEHIAFLRGLPAYWTSGDYLFVHAGIRPGVPIEQQSIRDLIWIRNDFLDHKERHTHLIVHGHTPIRHVRHYGNRINIDSGAYASGVLTALILEGDQASVATVAQTRAGKTTTQAIRPLLPELIA